VYIVATRSSDDEMLVCVGAHA